MTFARVCGREPFDGQAVQKEHVLAEGDIVEITNSARVQCADASMRST